MSAIDLTPLYRNSIGFDRLASLIDNAFNAETVSNGYPPYNIEMFEDDRYAITLAVAGFSSDELDISVEKDVLIVRGKKQGEDQHHFLHHGIATRSFERKFNLADHVEVTAAGLKDGLLTIDLVREIPESMKPRKIEINSVSPAIEHKPEQQQSQAA